MADYRPQTAAYDREIELWTYQDVVEHLLDFFQAPRAKQRQYRMAKRAVIHAYRDMPYITRWLYYDRTATISSEASQSTGTIAYDFTGGTYERELTLSGATWPANVKHFVIQIADVEYRVEDKKSTTVVTLEQSNCPQADVASSTAYIAFRPSYPLPIDFRKLGRLFDQQNNREIPIETNDEQHSDSTYLYDTPDTPWRASIRNTGEFFGVMELVFSPPPSAARPYSLIYEAMPFPLLVEKHSPTAAKVTTDGTTAVTGTDTAFDAAKHTGAILRLSGNTQDAPTGQFGDRDDKDNPFIYQRVIMSVTSATACVVDTAIPVLTNVKMTISSPIDIEQSAMFTMFLRMAEAEYARTMGMKTLPRHEAAARLATIHAMENDQRTMGSRSSIRYYDSFRRIITSDE